MIISDGQQWYSDVVNEIRKRLGGGSTTLKRAVLVFFKTFEALTDFREYCDRERQFSVREINTLTEKTPVHDKENKVTQAALAGTITFLTKEIGRGTDFKGNKELDSVGGMHVIQTFVSEELSEEVQIRGRTARQAAQGSYSLVLKDTDLQGIDLSADDIADMRRTGRFYDIINNRRNQKYLEGHSKRVKYVEQLALNHEESEGFLEALISGENLAEIKAYVVFRNMAPAGLEEGVYSRTVVLVDATGSMYRTLDACKSTVNNNFIDVSKTLKSKKLGGAFEILIGFYRNYSSKKRLFQHSPWVNDPSKLTEFLSIVECEGGQGFEAVEVGLQFVNSLDFKENAPENVTQVILIGDAPPNTPTEVTQKRAAAAFDWSKTQFSVATTVDAEVFKLQIKKIPVHAFYVPINFSDGSFEVWEPCKQRFTEIAVATGGTSGQLDINSSDGAQHLKDLVCKKVLSDIGGKRGGLSLAAELETEYERMLRAGYFA
jgi:hypothetical protein